MPMLNDRDHHLLKDLERQLAHVDPAWVSQFKGLEPPPPARRNLLTATAIGVLVLLTALSLLLDIPIAAVIFGAAAIVLVRVRYRL